MILSFLLLSAATGPIPAVPSEIASESGERWQSASHALYAPVLYWGAGNFFGALEGISDLGWLASQFLVGKEASGEFLIARELFRMASQHSFAQGVKSSALFFPFFKYSFSRAAWDRNQKLLEEVPTFSVEDKELVNFLQSHWLAKITGCYPFHLNWLCPAFGIPFQAHPESTNSYSRDPATKPSETYTQRINVWKELLPQAKEYPLILTRPFNIDHRLPLCIEMREGETIGNFAQRLIKEKNDTPLIADVTAFFSTQELDRSSWMERWHCFENQLLKTCEESQLDQSSIFCVQRVEEKDVGGIRLLPFSSTSKENIEKQHQYLIEWISRSGLTASRIELDRPLFTPSLNKNLEPMSDMSDNLIASTGGSFDAPYNHLFSHVSYEAEGVSRKEGFLFLDAIEDKWQGNNSQKNLMMQGTLRVLRALPEALSEAKWKEVMGSPTRSAIVQLCLKKIKEQLNLLIEEEKNLSFHSATVHFEQIHADFTALLEVFQPFTSLDFSDIYRRHLTAIPEELKLKSRYALHASAMTSLGAIFQAVQVQVERPIRILYGENSYFEMINLAERIGHASPMQQASEQDIRDADLILLQFNPTVKRINFKVTEYQATQYHVEKIAEIVRDTLRRRDKKPLSVAIDCTIDYSNSLRIGEFLAQFQKEIEEGFLNVICYRSGLKFDLFGMDNYCGAPFFLVNNQDANWSKFESLVTDPALQADRLSLNWFCLVYQHVASDLEAYRKQIFENTRAVLNKIPEKLFSEKNRYYRVIPMDADVDPSFLDIKIFGPLHAFRGELLVGVYLTLKCMEAGYPLLYRPGIGFYHPNLALLYGTDCTTVRLTVGLDPGQVDVIVQCLEKIAACNE